MGCQTDYCDRPIGCTKHQNRRKYTRERTSRKRNNFTHDMGKNRHQFIIL